MKKLALLAGAATAIMLTGAAAPAQAQTATPAPGASAANYSYVLSVSAPQAPSRPDALRLAPAYGDIGPFYGDIGPFYGDIGPFYGDIGPFYGDIGPFYGDIGAFWGDVGASYGDIGAFYGDIGPFYGDIGAFYGDIGAFYGDIGPFYGDIGPFYGDIGPFYGDIGPFYGDIGPFYGAIGAFWGDIGAFYGDIGPFYGDIGAFYGDIGPFYGDIGPFYGDIGPFYGDIGPFYGDIGAFYGDIGAFWGDIGPFWDALNAAWGDIGPFSADNAAAYEALLGDLNEVVSRSEAMWGEAVQNKTGQSFWDGFASDLFAKYGLDPNDPSSLDGMHPFDRSAFFMEWYDGLMSFTGVDHIDHWMPMVRWSPTMAHDQGFGDGVTIGLLDAPVEGDADLLDNLVYSDGYTNFSSPHGASVASLMVAGINGQGVMGVAQDADLANYNPYDETGTASWEDVRTGIAALGDQGASVINMSLGVSEWTLHSDWADILSHPDIAANADSVVLVKAAGNEGMAQTVDIDWNYDIGTQLLVVGSVNPAGRISAFSNTPGEACLLDNGACAEENKLKYRFLVAPGEFMLTSDGEDDIFRRSGTSVAAPLVSGAVALLHGRWPWLKNYAEESADIILQSARDLGEPGVDSTYGWGLLDIQASQSPLDYDELYFFEVKSKNGNIKPVSAESLKRSNPKSRKNWDKKGIFFYAFEDIGDTYRDFAIPFSDMLVGQSLSINGESERFQNYLTDRMTDWMDGAGFSDMSTYSAPLTTQNGWSMSMTVSNRNPRDDIRDGALPFQTGFVMQNPSEGVTLRFGHGEGAMALTGQEGFGVFSDYDGESGGVNPVLGLASGGAYAGGALDMGDRATLTFGVTQQNNEHFFVQPYSNEERPIYEGLEDYEAVAASFGAAFQATDRLTLNASYTRLNERTGLLGVQGLGPASLRGGASTDAATFGASIAFDYGFELSSSATLGHTGSFSAADEQFALTDGGLTSSAYSFALAKTGLFGDSDRMRLSFGQSLHIEDGGLKFASVQVIDRTTGEIGVVNQDIALGGDGRDYVLEALYALPVLDGLGEVSAFGRAEMRSDAAIAQESDFALGARFGIDF
ncbi:S8 family serine peptidase [Euryhalocaulis caribicus]|uniref:S8 family serine peptidase n=1 Tax=Euryhalocaulis caribicus TaxID=1161401 RepID=UPI00039EC575|nr:S8 family serine peptidase [Euryhalocaulis caribicus]